MPVIDAAWSERDVRLKTRSGDVKHRLSEVINSSELGLLTIREHRLLVARNDVSSIADKGLENREWGGQN
jgi:hypothetical protein